MMTHLGINVFRFGLMCRSPSCVSHLISVCVRQLLSVLLYPAIFDGWLLGLRLVCHIYLSGYTIARDINLQCVIRYTAIYMTLQEFHGRADLRRAEVASRTTRATRTSRRISTLGMS